MKYQYIGKNSITNPKLGVVHPGDVVEATEIRHPHFRPVAEVKEELVQQKKKKVRSRKV